MSRLTAIVVTYNCQDTITACLRSLKDNLPLGARVVVVDNNSSDQTVELIPGFCGRNGLYRADFVSTFGKPRFGAGNNYAMKRHPSEYFYLHNGDAYLQSKKHWKML